MFEGINLNYLAILVAGLSSIPIGMIWFGPLFKNAWMKETGLTQADAEAAPKIGYLWTLIAALVEAWVLAYFVAFAGADSLADG